jgi:hypothetical protein
LNSLKIKINQFNWTEGIDRKFEVIISVSEKGETTNTFDPNIYGENEVKKELVIKDDAKVFVTNGIEPVIKLRASVSENVDVINNVEVVISEEI